MSDRARRRSGDTADYRKELQKAEKAVSRIRLDPSHGAIAFFDLPGSTNLMKKDPREAIPIMLRHNALCRAIIEPNDGHIVKELGDGLMVIFANVGTAVSCACKVIQNLSQREEAICTKVSIAVGTVWKIERPYGYDVYGTPVHMSARMSEHASENTVLIDERDKNLVSEWLGRAGIVIRNKKIHLRSYGLTKVCIISVNGLRT